MVEGYTDVMACHLSGVPTAVATCGTAFGDDHARILRRLLLDHDEFRGEVIYTFDGDEAGQKAALRAFQGDQQFVGQTYVAVEPDGRDPCELRLAEGDAAVRELVARRVPLYRFVLSNVVSRYDLDRADARVDATREAARLVASDPGPVQGRGVRPRARRHGRRGRRRRARRGPSSRQACGPEGHDGPAARRRTPTAPVRERAEDVPDPRERRFSIERDVLKLALQHPAATAEPTAGWSDVESEDFVHPYYRAIFEAIGHSADPPRRDRTRSPTRSSIPPSPDWCPRWPSSRWPCPASSARRLSRRTSYGCAS